MSTEIGVLRLRLDASQGDARAVASAVADALAKRFVGASAIDLSELRLRLTVPEGLAHDQLAGRIADAIREALP